MNIDKLPKQIKQKLKSNVQKIATLKSSELLDYSKALRLQKDEIGLNVYGYLLNAIDERRDSFNTVKKTSECRDSEMIKEFQKVKR